MWTLGPLGFATPALLVLLAALPLLWLMLRALPPSPRPVRFAGTGLLAGLRDPRPLAARTPWWLLLLRAAAVAALIIGLAGPVWRPQAGAAADGRDPLLIVLDAGWEAAPNWQAMQARAIRSAETAARAGRPVALLLGDGRTADAALPFRPGAEIAATLRAAAPQPWPTTFPADPAAMLAEAPSGRMQTLWLSDGVEHAGRQAWAAELASRGDLTVVEPAVPVRALSFAAGVEPVLRTHASGAGDAPDILAFGPDPQGVPRVLARLAQGPPRDDGEGATARETPVELPPELRNRVTRFQLDGIDSAGAVVLADDLLRRPKVALIGAAAPGEAQALLSPGHYLRQALSPVGDIVEGGLSDALLAGPDVIVMIDQTGPDDPAALADWVAGGGVLIRFAGPRMASDPMLDATPLLPVRLRPGGRDMGGALSWGEPRGIAPFDGDGPFAGLTVPDEVTVRAQLMAEPSPELAARTLAALEDGTPLVTRADHGDGKVVLFHVTASADWSTLPISGLFVDLMARLVATAGRPDTSRAASGDAPALAESATLVPLSVLDGFGRLGPAPAEVEPLDPAVVAEGPAPAAPAGLYTAGERLVAINAGRPVRAIAGWPAGTALERAGTVLQGIALTGWLLIAAAVLIAADTLGTLLLAGAGRTRHRAASLSVLVLLIATLTTSPGPLAAQDMPEFPDEDFAAEAGDAPADPAADSRDSDPDPELVRAANEFALAYMLTGDARLDEISRQGLAGLSQTLAGRSTVEPGPPVAFDPEQHDPSLLSFIYWPVTDLQPMPSPQAYLRLNRFLQAGGMILFDTRDGDVAGFGGPDGSAALQRLAAPLDIPPLAPIGRDHVLTRSFYLLNEFPGRHRDAQLWVEAPLGNELAGDDPVQPFGATNDGVSPVVIGGNAWAEAWAIDQRGLPAYPIGAGLDGERQREMAGRFGVNLVMYALTGNYKSDQVHVPALLDRLRQEAWR